LLFQLPLIHLVIVHNLLNILLLHHLSNLRRFLLHLFLLHPHLHRHHVLLRNLWQLLLVTHASYVQSIWVRQIHVTTTSEIWRSHLTSHLMSSLALSIELVEVLILGVLVIWSRPAHIIRIFQTVHTRISHSNPLHKWFVFIVGGLVEW